VPPYEKWALEILTRAECRTAYALQRTRAMLYRLAGVILSGSVGLLLGGHLVIAADRIDLFDTNSNRTGYIIVDPKSGNDGGLRQGWQSRRQGGSASSGAAMNCEESPHPAPARTGLVMKRR
jgi:hypothetical protein